MKTELVNLKSLLLGGVNFYGDPFHVKGGWESENEIGKTFSRFHNFIIKYPDCSNFSNMQCKYEVHVYSDETAINGHFEIFVGEEISTPQLPISLCTKYIPASAYLKVTLFGEEITEDWCFYLDSEIIPSLGIKRNNKYIIQAYDERFLGMDQIEDSILDVFIPIEGK